MAPVILIDNWRRELERFFRPEVFSGLRALYGAELSRFRRTDGTLDVDALRRFPFIVTNYETLASNQVSLLKNRTSFGDSFVPREGPPRIGQLRTTLRYPIEQASSLKRDAPGCERIVHREGWEGGTLDLLAAMGVQPETGR